MGIDAGFDMVPRLSNGATDKKKWQSFIKSIQELYQNDDLVEAKPNYIVFKAGERYLDEVTQVAKAHFGSRVHEWNDGTDIWRVYDWGEVIDSFQCYDQLETPTSIAQDVIETGPTNEPNLEIFSVQPVQDKGRGLVASANIEKGTRILSEKPLLINSSMSSVTSMEDDIAAKLKALSKTEQRLFLSLHNNFPGKHPFSGITKTNALPCGPDSPVGGVYPTICLINHSCLPNAHNSWNSDAKRETIHAIRPIKAGEEITISYDEGDPSGPRRAHLKNTFGSDCNCSVCILPSAELEASDNRRRQIQLLDEAIGDPGRVMMRPEDSLADCHSLLQILQEEYKSGPSALSARLYYDAFQICIIHCDQARASAFAERGHGARVACEGEDSPETLRIKSMMENPARHRNFGASKRWRTAKGLVPKGLDADEFEKWLWRRAG
ncbi:MAG: hypothetical protein M1829_001315 [Trizodia sp. TS-e1964]|nr:MAG: hypothetical protein M1829_001315 [Trizodia sp. TS-e1964]